MKKVKLGDIAVLKTGPFGTQFSAKEYVESGIPVINVKNIGYGEINNAELDFIDEATRKRLSEHILKTGDIVFGRKGSVDRHAYIDERYDGWVQGSDCIRVRCLPEVNSKFVSHYLKLDHIKKTVNNSAVGSTMASLNTDILKDIVLELPSIEEQFKIEYTISLIEEKIRVNREINDNLVHQLQLYFDYWFNQFEFPDENGNPYKQSGGSLYADSKSNRIVPSGWRIGSLSEIADIVMGQSPSGDTYNESTYGMVFYQGSTDFGDIYPTTRLYTTHPCRMANINDTLLSVRAPVGTMNIAFEKCCIGRGLSAICGKNGNATFVRYLLKSNCWFFDNINNSGTTFGSITKDVLFEMPVIIPTIEIISKFEDVAILYEGTIHENERQNRELTAFRNWLLPMLMNGQATIED